MNGKCIGQLVTRERGTSSSGWVDPYHLGNSAVRSEGWDPVESPSAAVIIESLKATSIRHSLG